MTIHEKHFGIKIQNHEVAGKLLRFQLQNYRFLNHWESNNLRSSIINLLATKFFLFKRE